MLRSLGTSRVLSQCTSQWGSRPGLRTCRRWQVDASVAVGLGVGSASRAVALDDVLALWNEGNLFSLSVQQMQEFLQHAGVPLPPATSPTVRKAALVRRLEEYLHAKEAAAAGGGGSAAAAAASPGPRGGYGEWDRRATPPETLLDLAQSGFYDGAANMVPKAFQLLPTGSSAEVTVTRVNTSAFPGFPANTECYTLTATAADVAMQSRFSKVLQWCFLNMSNLQMDGELCISLGKLVLHKQASYRNEEVVSGYTLQQRLQLSHPYTWVTAVPESAIPRVEALLEQEGFRLATPPSSSSSEKPSRLLYEGRVKRAKDVLEVEMNESGQVVGVKGDWVNVQTVFHTNQRGPDVRTLLRTRPPTTQSDTQKWHETAVIELANDDVSDVLPAEMGQLVYLSENEVRRFEKVNHMGITLTATEVKRQPLIVLKDEEEDPRVEYELSVFIPAAAGGQNAPNVRGVGLELFETADRLAAALSECFTEAYGC